MSKLILVDSRVADIAEIAISMAPNTEMVVFNFVDDSFESLKAKITGRYESVCIAQHNYMGNTVRFLNCADDAIIKNVKTEDSDLSSWADIIDFFSWLKNHAGCQYIDLLACNIWDDPDWRYAILKLREIVGVHIRASVNITGAEGDFILESDNVNLIGIYFTENINNYKYQFYYQPTGTAAPHNAIAMQPTLPFGGSVSTTAYVSLIGSMINCGTGLAGTTYVNPPADLSGVVQFVSGAYQSLPIAYAAITNTGRVVTFGRNTQGGDSSSVASSLASGVTKVVATAMAFAALRSDGVVVSWGQVINNNGTPSNITTTNDANITPPSAVVLTNCKDIVASLHTFAALKNDGTVVHWGSTKKWASPASALVGVTKIKETYGYPNYSYVALKSNGHAVMWGVGGVTTTTSLTSTSPIVDIYATDYGCVIIRANKTVHNGFTNTIAYTIPAARTVLDVYAIYNSSDFAILMDDRSMYVSVVNLVYTNVSYFINNDTAYGFISNGAVITRGDARFGGSTTDTSNGIKSGISVSSGVIKLASTQYSMAALKSDGTVAVWGAGAGGWPYVTGLQSQLVNVVNIFDFLSGYIALTSDNKLISWGNNSNSWYGTPTSSFSNTLTIPAGKTVSIFSALLSPFIVENTREETVSPSTVDQYASNTITFSTNVGHNYAQPGRKYGLYHGSTRLATFTPTSITYSYVFQNAQFPTSGTLSCSIVDYTDVSFNVGTCSMIVNAVSLLPGTPILTSSTSGNTTGSITFIAPTSTGGNPITGYSYKVGENGTLTNLAANVFQINLTGLTNGTDYVVYVYASTSAGTTVTPLSVTITPSTIPSTPVITGVVQGSQSFTVSLSESVSNGGAPITGYSYSLDGGNTFISTGNATLPITISSGLSLGTDYYIYVKSTNIKGSSPSSAYFGPITAITTPSPPTNVVMTGGLRQLSVAFTPSTSSGITSYQYSLNDGPFVTIASLTSPFTITSGLVDGTTYSIVMRSVSYTLRSTNSNSSTSVSYGVPGTPILVSSSQGNATGSIVFSAPTTTGGLPITGYSYKVGENGTLTTLAANVFQINLTGLTNGTIYVVYVYASTLMGTTATPLSVSLIPSTTPSAPVITRVVQGPESFMVSLSNSVSDGGQPITGYSYSLDGGNTFVSAGSATLPINISGLSSGTAYYIYVRSTNSNGTSPSSAYFGPITAISAPSAPTAVVSYPSARTASVVIGESADTGNSEITGYTYTLQGQSPVTIVSPTAVAFSQLTVGETYSFSVYATNLAGNSSTTTISVKGIGLPAAPTITAAGGLGTAIVSVVNGAMNGGTLVQYSYSLDNGAFVPVVGTSSTFTITGLVALTTYSIRVISKNEAGDSVPSVAATAMPYSVPGAPVVSITSGPGNGRVAYTAGSSNGSPITQYAYSLNNGEFVYVSAAAFVSPYTIAGTVGTTYSVRVRAINSAGESPDATGTFTPYGPPLTPDILGVSLLSGGARVSFSCIDNGSPLTGVSYSLTGGSFSGAYTSAPTADTTFTLSGLTNGVSYAIRVRTTNLAGTSSLSSPVSFSPSAPQSLPNPPTITGTTTGDKTIVVSFTNGANTGSLITGYKYSVDGLNYIWAAQLSSPLTINSGLTNGTSYTVRIKSVNGSGDSAPSNSLTAMPTGAPSPPSITRAYSGTGAITVEFTDGATNGGAITSRSYALNGGTYVPLNQANTTSFTISQPEISVGQTYVITMKSQNAGGVSDASIGSESVLVYSTPVPPTLGVVSPGNRTLSIAFTQTYTGVPISRYEYSVNGGTTFVIATTITSPLVIPELTNGIAQTVQVRSITSAGTSQVATVSGTPMSPTLDAPTNLSVVPGNGRLSVSYSLGNTNGTGYGMLYSLNGGGFTPAASATNPLVITGLANSATYSVALKVQKSGIMSSPSTTTSMYIPGDIPTPPTITGIESTSMMSSISFEEGDYFASAIVGYKYTKNGGSSAFWTYGKTSPLKICDITPGTTHDFKIMVVTEFGESEWSNQVSSAIPSATINRPVITRVVPTDSAGEVEFVDGETNGIPITGYKYSLNGGAYVPVVSAVGGKFVVGELTNGDTYEVKMRTITQSAESNDSNTSAVFMPTTNPEPPAIYSVSSYSGGLSVEFGQGYMYGSELVGYMYSLNGIYFYWASEMESPIYINGLENGTTYSVWMKTVSRAGMSVASEVYADVHVFSLPDAPVITNVQLIGSSASVSFIPGKSNGGYTILKYTYSLNSAEDSDFDGLLSPLVISGLESGQEYSLTMKSATQAGDSEPSNERVFSLSAFPEPPTIDQVVAGNTSVEVHFTPGLLNSLNLIGYMYELNGSGNYYWVAKTESPIQITGLTNSIVYTVKMITISDVGQSNPSNQSESFIPLDVTPPPVILTVEGGDKCATISYYQISEPGVVITGYEYSSDMLVSYTPIKPENFDILTSTVIVDELTNGTPYKFYLRAIVNVSGATGWSNLSAITVPYTAPDPPTITSVIPGNKSALVYFTEGELNGSIGIFGYKYVLNGMTQNIAWGKGVSSPITIFDLENSTDYTISLVQVGVPDRMSSLSVPSSTFSCFDVPDQPEIESITTGNGQLTVSVLTGSSNGRPILCYKYSLNDGPFVSTPDEETEFIIPGLTNGTEYSVIVKAVNEAGDSLASSKSDNYVPFTVPSAPTIEQIFPENLSARVVIAATGMNGSDLNGETITGYKYSLNGGLTYLDADMTSDYEFIVPELENGTAYTIIVKRTTSTFGDTPASAVSQSFVPCDIPDAPTITTITPMSQKVVVAFTAGAQNGAAITSYKYSIDGGETFNTALQSVSPITIYALTNSTAYTIILVATNSAGDSLPSAESAEFMPFDIPFPPVLTRILPGNESALLYFDPINTNGSPLTGIKYSLGADGFPLTAITSPITIPLLKNKTTYNISIQASNQAGWSSSSNKLTVTPGLPMPPEITLVEPVPKGIRIYFEPSVDNGGPIMSYTCLTGIGKDTKKMTTVSPQIVSGLVNGVQYRPTMIAINKFGSSPNSLQWQTPVVPFDIPLKPTISTIVTSYEKATTFFNLPAGAANGSPITKYIYQLSTSPEWIDAVEIASPLIIPIPNNTNISIKIAAVNEAGRSPESLPKIVKFTYLPPAAPKAPVLTATLNSATIVVVPPAIFGAPILSYKYSINGGEYVDTGSNSTRIIVPDLLNNIDYNATVIASSAAGDSLPSPAMAKPSRYIYLPPVAAPAITAIVGGNMSVSVFFTAPAIRNAPITGYSYTLNGAPVNVNTTTSPIVIQDLINDTSYSITLSARTTEGSSPYSAAKPGIPIFKAPAKPVITASPLNSGALLSFTPPLSNGATITSYKYALDPSGTTLFDLSGVVPPLMVPGLTNDVSYNIVMYAINEVGMSVMSNVVAVKPLYTVPSAPGVGTITTTTTGATVVFTPSLPNGGTISSYSYSLDGGSTWVPQSASLTSPLRLTGLTTKTLYDFILKSENELGSSPQSAVRILLTK